MAGPDTVRSNPTTPVRPADNPAGTRTDTGASANKPTPQTPSTTSGVTVATRTGDTVQSVRQRAFEQMADAAGLSPAAKADFVQRATGLDSGGLNAPADRPGAEARPRSATEATTAIQRGSVVVAPTLAQEGLLKLIQAQDPGSSLPTGLPPSGAGIGLAMPRAQNTFDAVPGRAGVTPEVASSILNNVAQGKPPFNPDLGQVGRVSWFVTQGDPYVGSTAGKTVTLPVEVANTSGKPAVQFGEAKLLEIFNAKLPEATAQAETQLRNQTGKVNGEPLSNTNLKEIARNASRIAERAMWTEVGEIVRNSESGVGKVTLENSKFSKTGNGEFTLTSKAENVRLPKGTAASLVETIKARAPAAEPGVLEAAEKLAAQEKWTGRVQGAFRVGGKVLIVVGAVTDGYRIYTAQDKVKTTVEVAGGWAGAAAFGGAFAAWYAPADVAGPWAWLGHGVGTLGAGAIGYMVGSEVTKTVYELTIEGKPLEIGK